ncbi:MAG: hypothetical protein LE180_02565 [Endomicrobium sp.]|uniref:hypothetical protein n=1 Tax=Candidatus Endomicrobiellum pyrsonymphae TaxID=1408203 RepID=UPI00357DB649|nr:hypothetical protein [Endomicrobium sp.]
MKKIVSFFVLFCLLSGCATVIGTYKYADGQYAPTDVNKIEVYSTSVPERKYIELAEIRLSSGRNIEKVKEEASKLGADAIIISGATCIRWWWPCVKEDGIKCVAIKFKK